MLLFASGGEVTSPGKTDGINQWPSLQEDKNDSLRKGTMLNVG